MKTKLQRITLVRPDESKHRIVLTKLYDILSRINPQKSKDELRNYYFELQLPKIMNIVLISVQNAIIGFYSVTAYTYSVGKKTLHVLRAAIGLEEQFRGRKYSPVRQLCNEFIWYKLSHPFKEVVGIFFVENPFVYAMISKRVKHIYPNPRLCEPETIREIRKKFIQIHHPSEVENELILRIYFKVFFTESDLARINQSENESLKFYTKINPGFADGYSVLTIMPVTWYNIAFCLGSMIMGKVRKVHTWLCRFLA